MKLISETFLFIRSSFLHLPLFVIGGLLLGAALTSSCTKGDSASADASAVVAVVDGQKITRDAFDAAVAQNMQRYQSSGHALPENIEKRVRKSVMRRLIDDKVIEIKAKALGVAISEKELNDKFSDHKKRFRTDKAFEDYLKRSKNTADNMKSDLRRNLLRTKVVDTLSKDVQVSDEELLAYYNKNKRRFLDKEQVKVSRVSVSIDPQDPKKAKEAEQKIQAALAKAKAKGADFSAIAKQFSQGPEAQRGGDMGWVPRGRFPELDAMLFTQKIGAISKVIKTDFGWSIFKVIEKKEETQRDFEMMKDSIQSSLMARKKNETRREVLRTLKKDAKIEQVLKLEKPGEHRGPGKEQGKKKAPVSP